MKKIGDLVGRVLDRAVPLAPDDKEYRAVWERSVPRRIRNHSAFSCRRGALVLAVDNPTTGHQLDMMREKIISEYQRCGLAVREIRIYCR